MFEEELTQRNGRGYYLKDHRIAHEYTAVLQQIYSLELTVPVLGKTSYAQTDEPRITRR